MILSDREIRKNMSEGKIKIDPCDIDAQLGAVGVDLRLSSQFRVFRRIHKAFIDLTKEDFNLDTELLDLPKGETFILHPGEFVLGVTEESVELPNDIAARIDGRSSLGRLGIIVHSTAGHVDPGWKGRLTLEISNIGNLPIALVPGLRFCRLVFEEVSSPVERPYRGKYHGDSGPMSSKIGKELK
jgi:dCTP deaminase